MLLDNVIELDYREVDDVFYRNFIAVIFTSNCILHALSLHLMIIKRKIYSSCNYNPTTQIF